jgi:transcriptional regulator of acetoin/glycerol metabolism
MTYAWPKNVRELEKSLEAAMVLAGDAELDLEHFPNALRDPSTLARPTEQAPARTSAEDEERRRELLRLLAVHRGNLSAVARDLGKARFQVQRWIKRFALRPEDYR